MGDLVIVLERKVRQRSPPCQRKRRLLLEFQMTVKVEFRQLGIAFLLVKERNELSNADRVGLA